MSYYSPSRISTFEKCSLKFKFRYVDKIKPTRGNIEAFMGSRVHETLEKLYKDKMFHKTCGIDELIEFYNHRWEREMDDSIFVVKEEYSPENYREMGGEYIRNYYETYKPFDGERTIALEKMVFLKLGNHTIRGIIDRLSERDGIYEIHDYKTSMTLPTLEELGKDRQLALYALAVKEMYDAPETELVWHYVAFNREMRIKKGGEELERVRKDTIKKIMEIERAMDEENFSPNESALCPYCEYQHLCPLFKHKHTIEELPAEEVRWEDGRALVNKYWEVESKIKELEKIREGLKERIVDYARRNDVQYVYGSEKIANVKIYENPWFPDANDPRREEVEKILEQGGIYDRFTRLDTIALSNAYKNKELPPRIEEQLEKYMKIKRVSRIYLRKAEREE